MAAPLIYGGRRAVRLRTQRDGTIARTFRLARDPKTSLWKIAAADLSTRG